jgi:type II secretory pathway pseudopilin PulG
MKKLIQSIQSNRGQTIVEALVGFALIGIVGMAFVGGLVSLRNTTKNTMVMSSSEKQISDIAENIKSGVENYQINFNYDASIGETLEVAKLPMAWDNGIIAQRSECQECAGTFGYTIQPYESFRGLYKVTLRMTHTSWAAKGEPFRDYIFVVSAK